ncbi:MAG: rubredoxin [Thermoproteota archaeon]
MASGVSKRYRCTVCGYIYDPSMGDSESKIPPGTPFEKLPENWVCPLCGASKDLFEPED